MIQEADADSGGEQVGDERGGASAAAGECRVLCVGVCASAGGLSERVAVDGLVEDDRRGVVRVGGGAALCDGEMVRAGIV